jgi:cytochrome P450
MNARPTDFDHHSAAYAADPDAVHRQLRTECPVAWSDQHGGFWFLNRYDDVREVATHPERFSSRHEVPNDGCSYTGITIPEGAPFPMPPVESDPPAHRDYRRLLNPFFSPAAVEDLKPLIQDIVDYCIDQHIDSGAIDFVYHIGNPVPALVTMYLTGIPLDEWESFATPLHDNVAIPPDSPRRPEVEAQIVQVAGRIFENIAQQRTQPSSGVIRALIEGTIEGRSLDDAEIVATVFLLLSAGVDTTTALLSGVFRHLDQYPEQRVEILSSTTAVHRSGEEFLRYLTPNTTDARTATAATSIGKIKIDQGQRVLVNWYAANHDPAGFDDADSVDLSRWPNRHVAFGLGIHRCLGSHLARAIYAVTIPTVLRRMPDYRLDRTVIEPYADRGMVNGYVRMRGTFTPGPRVGATLPMQSAVASPGGALTAQ